MTKAHRVIFSGMQVLIEGEWQSNLAVVIEEGLIQALLPEQMIKHHLPAKQYLFPSDCYLIPGLIDLHIHGAAGSDVMDGEGEALLNIGRALAEEGVTGFLATTMTAESTQIEKVLQVVATVMRENERSGILGIHLEGPFISKEKLGAQGCSGVVLPDLALMKHWQKIANQSIKLVTLAPELQDALALISALHMQGVTVSIGHTDASYTQTMAAIQAGCTQATHLFNAMRAMHHRDPGVVCALLLSEQISTEIIADGVHVDPAVIKLALRIKGKDRILLVTDAMRAKCLGEGEYELGGQKVMVQFGQAILPDGTLAGSTLYLSQAIKNMMTFTGCTLADAIMMASYNPARALNLHHRKGTIHVGKDADLVVMDQSLSVLLTMRAGEVVFNQHEACCEKRE
jgi:N-acetylglucosamine-6-phosphate deacetylase